MNTFKLSFKSINFYNIFYILTFCIQKFNSLKLAPEPPKGDKMEKDGGSGGKCEPHGQ